MTSEISQRRLEALAGQARERSARLTAMLDRRRGLPAEPGDLFVLAATADLPVEWAVLERRAEARGSVLVVPADSNPLVGTADVEVREGNPGGPLSLRCRFGLWLDALLFDPRLRSGVLTPETVAEALDRCRQVELGALEPSPLAEEVDVDPEYMDWIREVPERARALAATGAQPSVRRFPARSWGVAHRLAAALALVAIGLSLWVVRLRWEVDRLAAPVLNAPSAEVVLGGESRGGAVVAVPREASHVLLVLAIDPSIGLRDGYLEIASHSGKPIWRSPRVRLPPAGELTLMVSRELLPNGDYRVRVYPEPGFGARPLATEALRIETAE